MHRTIAIRYERHAYLFYALPRHVEPRNEPQELVGSKHVEHRQILPEIDADSLFHVLTSLIMSNTNRDDAVPLPSTCR